MADRRCEYALKLVLFAFVISVNPTVRADLPFHLGSCANNRYQEALTFSHSRLSPFPIVLPGQFSVTSTLQVARNLSGDYTLDVTVERHFGFFKIRIPCFRGVGSCQYDDICGLLDSYYGSSSSARNARCPWQLRRDGVPCTCPVPAGTYTLRNRAFHVPRLEPLWAWLAQGDYRAIGRLYDQHSGDEIACQQLDLSIQAPCTSFWCRLFGA